MPTALLAKSKCSPFNKMLIKVQNEHIFFHFQFWPIGKKFFFRSIFHDWGSEFFHDDLYFTIGHRSFFHDILSWHWKTIITTNFQLFYPFREKKQENKLWVAKTITHNINNFLLYEWYLKSNGRARRKLLFLKLEK